MIFVRIILPSIILPCGPTNWCRNDGVNGLGWCLAPLRGASRFFAGTGGVAPVCALLRHGKTLNRLKPPKGRPAAFKPRDTLLAFLKTL